MRELVVLVTRFVTTLSLRINIHLPCVLCRHHKVAQWLSGLLCKESTGGDMMVGSTASVSV